MKSTCLITFIFFTLCGNIISQNRTIDSLEQLISPTLKDSFQVNILNLLSKEWSDYDIEQSKNYALRSAQLAESIHDLEGLATAYFHLANTYDNLGNHDSLSLMIQKCIEVSTRLSDSLLYLQIKIEEASLFSEQGDDHRATQILFEILEVAERNRYGQLIADIYNELGKVQMGLGNEAQSIEYIELALKQAEKNNDSRRITQLCINLAIAHDSIEIKRMYISRALALAKKHNYRRELVYAYNSYSYLQALLNRPDSSIFYGKLALRMAESIGEDDLIYMLTKSIAEDYTDQNIDSAEHYYNRLLSWDKIQTYSAYQDLILSDLAYVKRQKGKFEEAFDLLDSSYVFAKNRYRTNMEMQVADANTKYETERKEAQLANQSLVIEKQKNTRNIILLIGAVIIALIGFISQAFINKQKRDKREAQLALELEQQRASDLVEINQTKDNLFNNVSHELRTPLTMIIGPLEEVRKSIRNVVIKQEVNMALNNSKRLLNLVNEILDLSKIDAKKLTVEPGTVHLHSFLRRVYESFASLALTRKIILTDNFDDEQLKQLYIKTDPRKLETIMNNLISNAIKFSSSSGTVELNLNIDALNTNQLILSVRDEGVGISASDQKKIFDRFYQAPQQNHSAGTGIGLALTKELCELLGGHIDIQSEINKGSTFKFSIPIEKTAAPEFEFSGNDTNPADQTFESELSSVLTFGSKPNILIVEDDVLMSQYLESLLKQDYNITKAYNGKEAIEILHKHSFDLISSDVMMPEMDGFTFREQINRDPRIGDTPFIMLTARNLEEDKIRGFQLGIDDYLTKPFSPKELRARIFNLIKNKKSREELESEDISPDVQIVENTAEFIRSHIHDERLKISDLAENVNYSSKQLSRILKRTVGMSPVEFMLEVRLQHAYELLQSRSFGTINETRIACGISSPSYFSTKFSERFGIYPSELIKVAL